MIPRRRGTATLAGITAVLMIFGGPVSLTLATLSSSDSAGSNTLSTGRIFPGTRTTTAWAVNDASSGSAIVQNDLVSYAGDSRTLTTGAWASTYASTRYFELTFLPVLAQGVSISTIAFNFDYRPSATSSNACFYFDVRVASTSAVLATYGSSASPVACNATTTLSATSTSIPIVTSTTQADDLAVRVYMINSGATKTVVIDRATVTGSTPYQSFTLYQKQSVDASTGTAATTIWPLAMSDASTYTSTANWAAGFAATRFLGFTFPPYVPAGATVTAASLSRMYHTVQPSDTICWYMDVLNGASVIGTHGSTGTPISCSSSNSTFTSDTVTLAEVNSAAIANNVVVQLYNSSTKTNKSVDTLMSLSVTWSLP